MQDSCGMPSRSMRSKLQKQRTMFQSHFLSISCSRRLLGQRETWLAFLGRKLHRVSLSTSSEFHFVKLTLFFLAVLPMRPVYYNQGAFVLQWKQASICRCSNWPILPKWDLSTSWTTSCSRVYSSGNWAFYWPIQERPSKIQYDIQAEPTALLSVVASIIWKASRKNDLWRCCGTWCDCQSNARLFYGQNLPIHEENWD